MEKNKNRTCQASGFGYMRTNKQHPVSIPLSSHPGKHTEHIMSKAAANLHIVEKDTKDNMNSDRQKALDAALSQIERAFGKGSVMKLGTHGEIAEIETISTGSLGLDIALGIGGVPRGRIVEI